MLDLYFKFILNDDDTYLGVEHDKRIVEEWIKHNYFFTGKLFISDDLDVHCSGEVRIKNKSIESLTNGLFRWGTVNKAFCCANCENLKSLEGAPKCVGEYFNCARCKNLTTLEGAPEEVGWSFVCNSCNNLTSLKGAPEKVGGDFYCNKCENLKSLEYAPEVDGGKFVYSNCPNLKITDSDRRKYEMRDYSIINYIN